MLDGELRRLHRLGRFIGDEGLLRTPSSVLRVGAAVVAGPALIRRVLGVRRDVGEVGQQQHGRAAEMRLERAEEADGRMKMPCPMATPGLPVRRPYTSAMTLASCSWRTSTVRMVPWWS